MLHAASDPRIWELHPVHDRYKASVFREFFDGGLASGMAFAILRRDTGAIIGSSRYHDHDPEAGEIEIGWTFLVRDQWGGTTNREVKRLMLDHAFTFVDTVVFWVGTENWRSRRAMEKIGGRLRNGLRWRAYGGVDTPHVVFEMCRSGFSL